MSFKSHAHSQRRVEKHFLLDGRKVIHDPWQRCPVHLKNMMVNAKHVMMTEFSEQNFKMHSAYFRSSENSLVPS